VHHILFALCALVYLVYLQTVEKREIASVIYKFVIVGAIYRLKRLTLDFNLVLGLVLNQCQSQHLIKTRILGLF